MKPYQTKHQRASNLLIDYPYTVKLSETHLRNDHIVWLDEMFPDGYSLRWVIAGPHQLNFRNEQDRMLFVLRWA